MSTPCGVLAIISKKVFEKDFPEAEPGVVLEIERYNSANKNLAPLADGLPLFLVTVRPKEQLLLVAVLERLKAKKGAWVAAVKNAAPVADISGLVSRLRFSTGKGITAKPGALGMSLQTPRALTEEDVQLLRAAAGGKPTASPAFSKSDGGVREQLLAEVLAHPDSDEPRMVMADWLMEQGDPRGELISIQCRLTAGIAYLSTRTELRVRARELLEQYQHEWTGFRRYVDCHFKRGFVDTIEASAGSFFPKGHQLLHREPVRRLALTDCTAATVDEVGRASWAGRLRSLKLAGDIGDTEVVALAQTPHFARLTALNLSGCNVGVDGVRAIATSPHLTGLSMLALTGNAIGDEGVALLAQSSNLANCVSLYLSRTELGDSGLNALAASLHLGKLRRLGIDHAEVRDETLRTLAESENLPALKRVELQGLWPGQETVELMFRRFDRFDY